MYGGWRQVAILEIGCGGNVTTVRMQTEGLLEELLADKVDACLIRVNPELPLVDAEHLASHTIPLLSGGLAAVRIATNAPICSHAHTPTRPREPTRSRAHLAAVCATRGRCARSMSS